MSSMTGKLWVAALFAGAAFIGAGLSYLSAIPFLPVILMIVSALMVLGISMMLEDILIGKYDTPHDEDKHPPLLILFRAARSVIMVAMGVLIFYLAF
jgi:hypothetical protein